MGFAPNPFYGVCTLAACKPIIRRRARIGDYVMGTGSAKRRRSGYLVFWMKITTITTFSEYWTDPAFRTKKPFMSGSLKLAFGDNIYFKASPEEEYQQVYSFHSNRDGSTHADNFHDDVGITDRIMLSNEFIYFGGDGPSIPNELDRFVHKYRNHRRFADEDATPAIRWLSGLGDFGVRGEPTEWKYVRKRRFSK